MTTAGDLHLHTTHSDGTDTVSERVEQAVKTELSAIAITDHDTIADELNDRVAIEEDVRVITGVEVRADIDDTKVEILGYYVDPDVDRLEELLRRVRKYRRQRNERMITEITNTTGIDVSYETLRVETEGMIGRPHLAEILIDEGIVDTIGEAFSQYLGEMGSCFVPMQRVRYEEIIEAILASGGVASLAHPGRISATASTVQEIVRKLANAGLEALEVWYPYDDHDSERYADLGVTEARIVAEDNELIPTGGSDCHGSESGKHRIGSVRVPSTALTSLHERANERRPFNI